MLQDIVQSSKSPVSYTFYTNVNLAWLDLRITCRPPVIVGIWNPNLYCVSERWEAERREPPDLSHSSVKVREQQGPAEGWGPTAHINMHSHNVHECTPDIQRDTSTHYPTVHSLALTCLDIPVYIESQHKYSTPIRFCMTYCTCQLMAWNTEVGGEKEETSI